MRRGARKYQLGSVSRVYGWLYGLSYVLNIAQFWRWLKTGRNWSPWNCGMCCAYGLLNKCYYTTRQLTRRREENHGNPQIGQPLALSIFEAGISGITSLEFCCYVNTFSAWGTGLVLLRVMEIEEMMLVARQISKLKNPVRPTVCQSACIRSYVTCQTHVCVCVCVNLCVLYLYVKTIL